jgi:hypothetical protein
MRYRESGERIEFSLLKAGEYFLKKKAGEAGIQQRIQYAFYNIYKKKKKGSSLIKLTGIDANNNPITRWKDVVDLRLLHKLVPTFSFTQTYQLGQCCLYS